MIINDLLQQYGNQVAFIQVYLAEAHPIVIWWLGDSHTYRAIFNGTQTRGRNDFFDPKTFTERKEVATRYRKALYDNQIPVFVDQMDNRVGELYAAKPTRIYLIDKAGKVIYNPGFGPLSFNANDLGEN